MSFRIYVVEHAPSYHIDDPNIVPLHVGAARSKVQIQGALRDDTGDNISHKNDTYCELTGIYWVWKNAPKTDFVGFFHYRRHLDFRSSRHKHVTQWGVIDYPYIDDAYLEDCGLDTKTIEKTLELYDLVLPTKWNVTAAGSADMFDHFRRAPHQKIDDLQTAIAIVNKSDPAYKPYVQAVNRAIDGRFTNMFVMRWELFDAYCTWLFDVLAQLEARLDLSDYSVQQRRVFGFIAEWLTNYFVERYLAENPTINVIDLNRTFIKDTPPAPSIKPAFSTPDACAIVTAFDNGYAKYAAAFLASVRESCKAENKYDILVLHFGLSEENIRKLGLIVADRANISLRFFDTSAAFRGKHLRAHAHFSMETYCRLKIPALLATYERVVYIDPDTIVLRDLAELARVDMKGALIAATRDLVMAGFRKYGTPSTSETGKLPADAYLRRQLGMKNPAGYFQAGVLVFDIKAVLTSSFDADIDAAIGAKPYWFLDQDILNVALEGRVTYVDGRWDALFGNGDTETFFAGIAAEDRAEFFASLRDPWVVHFAGERKPWKVPGIKYGESFWHFARMTPFYEELLSDVMRSGATANPAPHFHSSLPAPVMQMPKASRTRLESLRDSMRLMGYLLWPVGWRRRTKRRLILHAFRSTPRKEQWQI